MRVLRRRSTLMEPMGNRLRRHAPATLRNQEPILAVLKHVLPAAGVLLEVASGSGEHAAFIAPRLPFGLEWQPSEASVDALADIDAHASKADCSRIRRAILLDTCDADWPVQAAEAVFCCNMIHIAPWEATEGLFAGSSRILANAAPLILYGPFKRDGVHTAPFNRTFDDGLRVRNAAYLAHEVEPVFESEDLIRLPNHQIYLRLIIDGDTRRHRSP